MKSLGICYQMAYCQGLAHIAERRIESLSNGNLGEKKPLVFIFMSLQRHQTINQSSFLFLTKQEYSGTATFKTY